MAPCSDKSEEPSFSFKSLNCVGHGKEKAKQPRRELSSFFFLLEAKMNDAFLFLHLGLFIGLLGRRSCRSHHMPPV